MTPEERAVLEAAETFDAIADVQRGPSSHIEWTAAQHALHASVAALHLSRKPWKIDRDEPSPKCRILGPRGISMMVYVNENYAPDEARKMVDRLNADEEAKRGKP